METFALIDHPKAKRYYAWLAPKGSNLRYTTVLELSSVNSPQSAVKVAMAAAAKRELSDDPEVNVRE